MNLSSDQMKALVDRAYPGGKSGMCSRHGPGLDDAVECTICFPDVWALIREHNRLKQAAWKRLTELGEEIPGL